MHGVIQLSYTCIVNAEGPVSNYTLNRESMDTFYEDYNMYNGALYIHMYINNFLFLILELL